MIAQEASDGRWGNTGQRPLYVFSITVEEHGYSFVTATTKEQKQLLKDIKLQVDNNQRLEVPVLTQSVESGLYIDAAIAPDINKVGDIFNEMIKDGKVLTVSADSDVKIPLQDGSSQAIANLAACIKKAKEIGGQFKY